jgi:hypothetical protein
MNDGQEYRMKPQKFKKLLSAAANAFRVSKQEDPYNKINTVLGVFEKQHVFKFSLVGFGVCNSLCSHGIYSLSHCP